MRRPRTGLGAEPPLKCPIRVVAKVCPEKRGGRLGGSCLELDPSRGALLIRRAGHGRPVSPPAQARDLFEGSPEGLGAREFAFDQVFGPETTQADFLAALLANSSAGPSTDLPLGPTPTLPQSFVQQFLAGFNVTVLAYGQTGSGKTHTMGGEPNALEEGLIPRVSRLVLSELSALNALSTNTEFHLSISFLELHQEQVRDLLDLRTKHIFIRETAAGDIVLQNLKSVPVTCTEELLDLLELGTRARMTGETLLATHSSRSHSIFTLTLEQTARSNYPPDSGDEHLDQTQTPRPGSVGSTKIWRSVKRSKFHLVDLAGSERLKRTGAEGLRFKESVAINSELLALGNVISTLAKNGATHIPYRNAKLTRILQDSLGGNAQTIMIACVSPDPADLDETIQTLNYAARAREILNRPTNEPIMEVAEDPSPASEDAFESAPELPSINFHAVLDPAEFPLSTQGLSAAPHPPPEPTAVFVEELKASTLRAANANMALQVATAENAALQARLDALASAHEQLRAQNGVLHVERGAARAAQQRAEAAAARAAGAVREWQATVRQQRALIDESQAQMAESTGLLQEYETELAAWEARALESEDLVETLARQSLEPEHRPRTYETASTQTEHDLEPLKSASTASLGAAGAGSLPPWFSHTLRGSRPGSGASRLSTRSARSVPPLHAETPPRMGAVSQDSLSSHAAQPHAPEEDFGQEHNLAERIEALEKELAHAKLVNLDSFKLVQVNLSLNQSVSDLKSQLAKSGALLTSLRRKLKEDSEAASLADAHNTSEIHRLTKTLRDTTRRLEAEEAGHQSTRLKLNKQLEAAKRRSAGSAPRVRQSGPRPLSARRDSGADGRVEALEGELGAKRQAVEVLQARLLDQDAVMQGLQAQLLHTERHWEDQILRLREEYESKDAGVPEASLGMVQSLSKDNVHMRTMNKGLKEKLREFMAANTQLAQALEAARSSRSSKQVAVIA